MIKSIIVIAIVFFGALHSLAQPVSIYTIKVPLVNGIDSLQLNTWQGKKILIVNTASQSNYVSQFAQLEQLYQQFKDSNLVILACPSTSFGNEPYNNQQVSTFCTQVIPVTYKVSAITNVLGTNMSPLYLWLTSKSQNGVFSKVLGSDFSKFLINGQGQIVGFFAGSVSPVDNSIINAIRAN